MVTGGGRGIGRAIAGALARAGAKVAVVSRTASELDQTVREIESSGGAAMAISADLRDEQSVRDVVERVGRELGGVSLLVNNAGRSGSPGPFWEMDSDDWWNTMDVNLRAPYLCAKAVVPGMLHRGVGRIVNIASSAGLGAWPRFSAYAVSKTALIRLTETMAAELADTGVYVFAMGPGFVRTAMTQGLADSRQAEEWLDGVFRKMLASGNDISPDLAAELVCRLASGRADSLSGRYVSVRDDLEALIRQVGGEDDNGLFTLQLRGGSVP